MRSPTRTFLSNSVFSRTIALLAASALVLGATGCAPEPDQEAGSIDKELQTLSPETTWGGQDMPEQELQTTLPESFPKDTFVLPEGSTIFNAGEKNPNTWFVVLNAQSAETAQQQWDSIILESSLTVSESVETTEGGISATLSNAVLTVQAVTIPQPEGSVLLSYYVQLVAL